MAIDGNKYHSTIKVEFRDLIDNLVQSNRKTFHLYTIHRLLSLGLLVDFTFQYVKVEDPETHIGIELSLDGFGEVLFIVDIESNYVGIASDNYKDVLQNFLDKFDTSLEKQVDKKRVF
jgi:hypothetical protein